MPNNVAGLYIVILNEPFTVSIFVTTPVESEPGPIYKLFTAKLCKIMSSIRIYAINIEKK